MIPGLRSSGLGLGLLAYVAIILGWILADFQVPHSVYSITLGLTVHLAWVGTEAIFLSALWVLGLLWVAVIKFAWPVSLRPAGWSEWVMVSWVLNLTMTWLIASSYIFAVALNHKTLVQGGCDRRVAGGLLVSLAGLSLGAGWLIHRWVPVLFSSR